MDMIKIHASRNHNGAAQVLVEHFPTGSWLVVSASPVIKETAIFPAVTWTYTFTGAVARWDIAEYLAVYKTDKDIQTVLTALNTGDIKAVSRRQLCL
jgi:hypothetical protein